MDLSSSTKTSAVGMVYNFSKQHSLVCNWVSELRDTEIQHDRMRFRRNLERLSLIHI